MVLIQTPTDVAWYDGLRYCFFFIKYLLQSVVYIVYMLLSAYVPWGLRIVYLRLASTDRY